MNEGFKKEAKKVLKVAFFLFVSIFFILPYLVQVSTYFHERGHFKTLREYRVESYYELDLLSTIPNFFNPQSDQLGVTRFSLTEYRKLDKYQRTEVNIAGIVSDLKFLFLIAIYLTISNVYIFYKIRFGKDVNLTWALAINWILFMWLLALVQITLANVTYPLGDIYQLVKFLRV